MVSVVLRRNGRKDWHVPTLKELRAELRVSLKSIQRAYRTGKIPVRLFVYFLVVAPGYI